MQAEYFALEGISELISTLERVRAAFNPRLTIEGVLLTMYDDRTNLAQQVTETLREYFKERLFRTVIPRNIRLAEAPSHGKPVALYDPRSRGTEAYFELAGEFMARNNIEIPRSMERKAAVGGQQARSEGRRFVSGLTPDCPTIEAVALSASARKPSRTIRPTMPDMKDMLMKRIATDTKRRALGKGLDSLLPRVQPHGTCTRRSARRAKAGSRARFRLSRSTAIPFRRDRKMDEEQLGGTGGIDHGQWGGAADSGAAAAERALSADCG